MVIYYIHNNSILDYYHAHFHLMVPNQTKLYKPMIFDLYNVKLKQSMVNNCGSEFQFNIL